MKNLKKCFTLFIPVLFLATGNVQGQALSLANNNVLSWISQDSKNEILSAIPENLSKPISEAAAAATCFCKVSFKDLSGHTSATFGVCLDLTGVVNKTYGTMSESNQVDCKNRCATATTALSTAQKQAAADYACGAGVSDATPIRSYSAVGTQAYRIAKSIGFLVNTPEQSTTTCKCPAGWKSNTSGQDGGVTTDTKCYKMVCGPMNINPLPPNNTAIGTWGLVRGNQIQAWGTLANGGAAECKTHVYFPKECKIQ